MKRSVLLGLFVTASMLASSSFAASDDLCATNLQTIANAKSETWTPEIKTRVEASVQQAKAYQAQNTEEGTKKCISETTQTLQEIENVSKDGKSS
ncbi:tmRNA [Pseudomonas syringae]|uniref:TmRNA n=1 Tax=Pseudomonas syringae TaxID=317 RepID=A0A0L1ME60_PSESX|nr:tmRNA [Pseudomonas syringae]